MLTKVDAIVAGHLCLDIIPHMTHLQARPVELWKPGSLHQVGKAVLATGGAVSNVGLALHRLGISARLLGKVGDDRFGDIVRNLLNQADPALCDSIIISAGEDTSYSLVLSPGASDRLFLHHAGVNDTYCADDLPDRSLESARLLHFGYPTCMRRLYCDGGRQLQQIFAKAKSLGLTTSLDMTPIDPQSDAALTDWPAFFRQVLPHVDLFLPSFDEIASALGYSAGVMNTQLLNEIAGLLLQMGTAVVAFKLGDQGLYVRTTADRGRLAGAGASAPGRNWLNRELLAPCFEVEVAGTTGAGDCTIAGFLAALLNAQSPQAALTAAVGVGAFCVEKPDATSGVPSWKQLHLRLARPWSRKPVRMAMDNWVWSEQFRVWMGPDDAPDAKEEE